jgi:hypothetical protein
VKTTHQYIQAELEGGPPVPVEYKVLMQAITTYLQSRLSSPFDHSISSDGPWGKVFDAAEAYLPVYMQEGNDSFYKEREAAVTEAATETTVEGLRDAMRSWYKDRQSVVRSYLELLGTAHFQGMERREREKVAALAVEALMEWAAAYKVYKTAIAGKQASNVG